MLVPVPNVFDIVLLPVPIDPIDSAVLAPVPRD